VLTEYQTPEERITRLNRQLGKWCTFWRFFPHRCAKDYLGIQWLADFQKALLFAFFHFTYLMIIASRGMGKSLIVALTCVLKCILYPGIQIVIAAGNRGQSINVLNKIVDEFLPQSNNLAAEIDDWSVSPQNAYIKFHNGSQIKVVTAKQSARSARAHLVICDEFIQISQNVITGVLRKFKAGERTPGFYRKKKYKNVPKDRNGEIYISSAGYKYHWGYAKFKSFFKSMIKGESYAVFGFPYQLPVAAGYYPAEQIREEMQEDDFDEVLWSMEMDSLWYGQSSNAFFAYEDLDHARRVERAIYPRPYYLILNSDRVKYQTKSAGEVRILAADIAVMGGNKNDATCLCVLQLIPANNGQFIRNLVYMETIEGGHSMNQAVRIRQLYDDLDVDWVVIDTNGAGMGIYDALVVPLYDEERGITYEPWSCKNDNDMAIRCVDPDAPKIIYSIKATAAFNSEAASSLRDCIRRGKLRLLQDVTDGMNFIRKRDAYKGLSAEDQLLFEVPYLQTDAFINETVNLSYEITGQNKIKVSEASGMRKDRYSSVSYANTIANIIERDVRKSVDDLTFVNAPRCVSRVAF
jgi:hypothetical protein